MCFNLFLYGIFQAEDRDERTQETEVYSVPKLELVYTCHQGREEQLQLMIWKMGLLSRQVSERGIWKSIFHREYRWADGDDCIDGNNCIYTVTVIHKLTISFYIEHTNEEIHDEVPNKLRWPKRAPMMLPSSRPLLTCVGNFQEYLLSLKIRTPWWRIPSAIKKWCQDSMWSIVTGMCRRAWAICQAKLFSTVSRPIGCKVVEYKWASKTKLDNDGQVEQYKTRLIDQDFSQIPWIDSDETFYPVIYHQTLQMLLALVNQHCWHVHRMDVKSVIHITRLSEYHLSRS